MENYKKQTIQSRLKSAAGGISLEISIHKGFMDLSTDIFFLVFSLPVSTYVRTRVHMHSCEK